MLLVEKRGVRAAGLHSHSALWQIGILDRHTCTCDALIGMHVGKGRTISRTRPLHR